MSNGLYTKRRSDAQGYTALAEMALDMRWSWNHSADKLWERLDPELWELTHNPWLVVQTVSLQKLREVTADVDFQKLAENLLQEKGASEELSGWFQKAYPDSILKCVAYFSMEFMLSEALPIYSGGLGNVAGDQLKTASNLGVPVIGVGLLYQQGYFRQEIDAQGQQHALYPYNDPGQLPIRPVREPSGEWVRFTIPFPGSKVWVRAWQVKVGRTKLYLLDTNDAANSPVHRGITSGLYGGDQDLRLKQELVLGIGGWRLLRAIGLLPEVCHLNEGHAAFAVLERARCFMNDDGQAFEPALTVTRVGNLFTTHTPVEAGFDRFSPDLMETYFKSYAEQELSIPFRDLLALGRRDRNDTSEPFNMAYLAIRGSGSVNGVSRLHGEVSRRIFQVLFPRWPTTEVPISHVTNGVHAPTWDSAESDRLWEIACGKDRWRGTTVELEEDFRRVSDRDLCQLRADARRVLVTYVRKRLALQLAGQGASPGEIAKSAEILDPNILTLGFARRFAAYKRPNLLLYDQERLAQILTNQQHPVQLILAGKAHPQDLAGQAMIQQWMNFLHRPGVSSHIVFLSDYDMLMAEHLVQGTDVWINMPRRPWEACGTSGMKVLVNGGLNLSVLDGWWAEAYTPEVGWALGDGKDHGNEGVQDKEDAEALYTLLEKEVIPEFYLLDEKGIPAKWVNRIRESMARLTPAFSANRAVREYTENHYLPAAAGYLERAANRGQRGRDLLSWRKELERHWPSLRFGSLHSDPQGDQYCFKVQVYFGELDPDSVKVELYAESQDGGEPFRQAMSRAEPWVGSSNGFIFTACAPANRLATDYAARLIPFGNGALVPLEAPFILWHDPST